MNTQLAKPEDPIFAYRQEFIKAAKAGDTNTLVLLATEDIVLMSPNDTSVYGAAEYRAWWEEYFQYFRVVALVFDELQRDVIINGDFAIERSAHMIAVVPAAGGTRIRDDGQSVTIWKRQSDGSWKIWQMMWNSSKPIGIGTNRYMSRLMQKKVRPQR